MPAGGTWIPAIRWDGGSTWTEETLLAALGERLARSVDEHPAHLLSELEAVSGDDQARRRLLQAAATDVDRARADWAAAVVSDAAPPESINQLQTARRDYFYGNIASVVERTEIPHLRRAIFRPWDYSDALDNQSLHWDPSEDRRHAHQWNKPAGDPDRKKSGGMLGANRLALEAIPLFPSFPQPRGRSLRTLGFTGQRATDTRWTWPIWNRWLTLPVVQSLMGLPELQSDSIDPSAATRLKAAGVIAVYRTRRIVVGKTPNFTPSRRIA
jgi:CRISPR-associated endonuclease/helicase Cas3